MFGLTSFFLVFSLIQEAPYKPSEEFDVKLDLSFKQRPAVSMTEMNFTETRGEYEKRTSSTPIPYLQLHVVLTRLSEGESRVKVVRDFSDQLFTKRKLQEGQELLLDMGYVDDLKDHVKGYHHEITFYDDKRKEVSRIIIEFDRDGNYLVNGEKRGKL